MKTLLRNVTLVGLLGLLSTPAFAWGWNYDGWKNCDPKAVPEIDGANAGLALALTSGLIAISRERRKKK